MAGSPKVKCSVTTALIEPALAGVNTTWIVHDAPAATSVQSCVRMKSAGASVSLSEMALVPVFVTVTEREPSELCIDSAPKSSEVTPNEAEPGPGAVRTVKVAERPPTVSVALVAALLSAEDAWRTQTDWPAVSTPGEDTNVALHPIEYSPLATEIGVLPT